MGQFPTTQAGGFPVCSRAMWWNYIYFVPINSHTYWRRTVANNVME